MVVGDYRLSRQPELGASILPMDGVAFELYRAPQRVTGLAPASFPLSLADFHFVGRGPNGPSPYQREYFFSLGRADDWALVWTGGDASSRSRRAVRAIVASVRVR